HVAQAVASVPGLILARDGAMVDEAQWGTPLPVDAGLHEVVVTAPGRKAWKKQVEVTADGAAVSVTIGPPAPEAVAADKPLPVAPSTPSVRPEPAAAPSSAWQRPMGLAAMGFGAVGAGVGAALGGIAIQKNGKSNDGHCDAQDRCDKTGFDLRREARAL